ncbi:MAG: FAD-binding oxidoreductase [Thermaerobacter sp.]|nr:FAD-binding oxidoreductase [Thermaerobacter sp.]
MDEDVKIPDTLTGLVVDRFSPLYDEARMDYNTGLPPFFPKYIVFCFDVHDVQNAVRWSQAHGLPIRARSGRHSYEGYSLVDGGVVIDVSRLNQVELTHGSGKAVIGAGADLQPIYQKLWDDGRLTIPGGSCPTVGIAGLTLGGGFGSISRLFGLTCDVLESLEMVDVNGDVIRASESENENLFWASCGGGGGNFGIVTSFTFKTFPIDKVTVFTLTWRWPDLRAVMKAFQVWADPQFLDRRVVPILKLTSEQAGQVAVVGEFVGPLEDMFFLLQPLIQAAQCAPAVRGPTAVYFFAGLKPPHAENGQLALLLLPHPFSGQAHEKFKNTSAYQFNLFPDATIDTMYGRITGR